MTTKEELLEINDDLDKIVELLKSESTYNLGILILKKTKNKALYFMVLDANLIKSTDYLTDSFFDK